MIKIKTPSERIVRTDSLATVFNAEKFIREGKFLVDLACGHKAYTRARSKIVCQRCTEMLRRSIETGEEDYESYREGNRRDEMIWREDPCRMFNEPTNLVGEFVND